MSGPALIGTAALLGGVGLVAAAARMWSAAARGRYRAPVVSVGPVKLRTTVVPPGAVVAGDPLTASNVDHAAVRQADENELAARLAGGEVDVLEYALCPAERRTTPHALRADGSRRCWQCEHTTAGDS